MLDEEPLGYGGGVSAPMTSGAVSAPSYAPSYAPAYATGPTAVIDTRPQLTYSGWNVFALFVCLILMTLAGIMMVDMLRHMWSWNEGVELRSPMMDKFVEWIGW